MHRAVRQRPSLNLCPVPRLPLHLASLFVSLVFLLVNLTCAVLVKTGTWERKVIVSVRVAINDTLFVLCAVSLSICLYKISKMSLANIYLESKVGLSCRPADLKNQLGDAGYVVFGVVLFVWELLPTTLVVVFFRVRSPARDLAGPAMVPNHGFSPRSYFFDNPRRYDSDDDLAWNVAPPGLQGSFAPDYYDWGQQSNSFLAQIAAFQPDSVPNPDKPCQSSFS
ncbi:PREDICTED: integral membrane protein GPR137B [Condylura cristata]|uniref:integral membrane protein GPR137B n=1 Tax=Condylura cristata TaxID=143302 RepID=UPI000642B77F|nr:PREDICTED: integral membrane protein GPR137B [Condylura cristata]